MILSELESRIRNHPEPLVVMGIGAPGTRKTELLKPLVGISDFPAVILSSNRTRARLNHLDKSILWGLKRDVQDAKIRRSLFNAAAEYLYNGRGVSVIYDGTNDDPFQRREDIEMFRSEFGAKAVIGMYFDASYDVAYERVLSKQPDRSLIMSFFTSRQLLQYKPPQMSEGFDEIIHVDTTNDHPVIS